jgi:aryl-alcohol dehydrogenase-like predicted oxidoreductase
VALAWVLAQPGVSAPIVGASQVPQLHESLAALDIRFTPEQLRVLDEASAPEVLFPYGIFTPGGNKGVFGGATVQGWR